MPTCQDGAAEHTVNLQVVSRRCELQCRGFRHQRAKRANKGVEITQRLGQRLGGHALQLIRTSLSPDHAVPQLGMPHMICTSAYALDWQC